MSELKTKPTKNNVNEFIAQIAVDKKRQDITILRDLFSDVTQQPAVMWGDSMVGFGRYAYSNTSGTYQWFMTGFAPRSKNITLYIMLGFERYQDLLQKLGKHKIAKSCLYINKLADIDLDVLKELIKVSYEDMTKAYPCNEDIKDDDDA